MLPEYGFGVVPSLDASLIVAANGNSPIAIVLDALTGMRRHELSHGKGNLRSLAWSPDGKWLATGATDKLARVWNAATGKIEHELSGHTGTISTLAWSPDGTNLASAAEDKTVRLWDPRTGTLVATYDQFPETMNIGNDRHSLAWDTNSRLGILFPWLTGDNWLCLGPTGHYRGSPGVEEQIVYVAMHEDGSQRTYTPAEFSEKFGWKNDPEQAYLLGPDVN